MAKPVHPATVHFPIAFLLLGYGLDILQTLRPNLPGLITSNLLAASEMTRASYYLLCLGLITSIPAVVTGGGEAVKMISKQGMYDADGKTIKTKVKATIAHAVANDIVIAASTYIWWNRRALANNTLAGKTGLGAEASYAPETWMVGAEVVIAGVMLLAANIGGNLTYTFGVGFSSASANGKKKQ